MIAVWQKKGQQMVQVDKTKQEAATGHDFHSPFFCGLFALPPASIPFPAIPLTFVTPFLQTDEKLLVKYLPDFMRFRAFSDASVRNGL
jgi:hypothetical protein